MNSWKIRSLVICSALTAVMLFSSDAQAGWRHYAGSYGGCYGCYGGSIGYGSYGCWGSYGGCYTRPVGYRWRHHHYAYYGGWGSYGCYGGSYGCCGGCYVVSSCGCCGGSYGGSYDGDVYYSPSVVPETAPVAPDEPTPADPPAAGQPLPDQQTLQNSRDALLTVSVPKGAQIFVNGSSTRSTGEKRRYVSRNLNPGYAYTYEVRAEMEVNGEMVERTKTVRMKAGQTHDLAFNFDVLPAPETVLTLNVPEDADVYLAGNKTRGNGKVRTFRTTKLADGQTWNDYTIRVTVNRNGQELSKEERISLNAGDSRELTIDVDGDKLAIAR
jgi:uncharacterized protein (TIGR03000 family)